MPWRRVVIRPDSIIRFWSLNLADVRDGLSETISHDAIRDIAFDQIVAMGDGSEHIRVEEFATFVQAMAVISGEVPGIFQELGQHFESLGRDWLTEMAALGEDQLAGASDQELADAVRLFVRFYRRFAPILWLPFVVESRYAKEYPAVLEKVVAKLTASTRQTADIGHWRQPLAHIGESVAVDDTRELTDAVRAALEHSPRRTMAEEKEVALLGIGSQIEGLAGISALFGDEEPPTAEAIGQESAPVLKALNEAVAKHGWIAHWGYPPIHSNAEIDDFVAEVHTLLRNGAEAELSRREALAEEAEANYGALIELAELAEAELQLVRDINYYNFLRTYRMELLIRAQYLTIPLFREIERRGIRDGAFGTDDVFYMVPAEAIDFLESRIVPPDLQSRRAAWALVTSSHEQSWEVLTGADYKRFADGFLGVIGSRENGKGSHNPTPAFVGGKATGLYALNRAGAAVPDFFVVTTHAYRSAVGDGVRDQLRQVCSELADDLSNVEDVSRRARAIVEALSLAPASAEAVTAALNALTSESYAIRSSAVIEDSSSESWAGRFDSELGVAADEVVARIPTVWSSLFSVPALTYAYGLGKVSDQPNVDMAVVVQELVVSDAAGVVNSVLDTTRPTLVEIEVVWGLGSAIVDGELTPSRFVVDTANGEIKLSEVAKQDRAVAPSGWRPVGEKERDHPPLSNDQVLWLAREAKRLEESFGGPQDLEIARAADRIFIVQSRPQTGLESHLTSDSGGQIPHGARLLVTGLKGKVATHLSGTSQVLTSLDEAKEFRAGNVLVLGAATPAWDPVIFRACALITDEGGATSHAIRVANERGIPAVVGTSIASDLMVSGGKVHIDTASDPFQGRVFSVPPKR